MYNLVHIILRTFFRLVFRWKISGLENIPPEGGVIIAANHISLLDPPVVGTALPVERPIYFMAKEELFANAVVRWFITKLHSFPIRRGSADRVAIRKAIALLESGQILGVFPEGTRSKTGKLGQPEPGVAMIAIKAGAPIVPTAIIGTNQVFSKGSWLPVFKVRFGKPIQTDKIKSDKESLEMLSNSIMREIACLLEEH